MMRRDMDQLLVEGMAVITSTVLVELLAVIGRDG